MTIEHHPEEATLTAYAVGALDLGQRVAVATHLAACPRCRGWTRAMERVGGAFVADSPPVAMAADALARTLARLDAPAPAADAAGRETADAPIELPKFVRGYDFGRWRWVRAAHPDAADPSAGGEPDAGVLAEVGAWRDDLRACAYGIGNDLRAARRLPP